MHSRRSYSELFFNIAPPLLCFRALPHHAGISFQRDQPLARVSPILPFLDVQVIAWFAAGARREKRARNIDHVRRALPLIDQRRAASRAKASCRPRLVLEARDPLPPLRQAEMLAPDTDVGGIGRVVGAPARARMIVPGPERRKIDLELDRAAEAVPGTCSLDFFRAATAS